MPQINHFTESEIYELLAEMKRKAPPYKYYVDPLRSKYNFRYSHHNYNPESYIKKRCDEIMQGRKIFSYVKVLSEWTVTYPVKLCNKVMNKNYRIYYRPIDYDKMCKFFNIVWDFTNYRYGKNNMVEAYVHMDENIPHIHMLLIPKVISKTTGRMTISKTNKFTIDELQNYQKDLQTAITKTFGEEASNYILDDYVEYGNILPEEETKMPRLSIIKDQELSMLEKDLDLYEESLRIHEKIIKQKEQELEEKEKQLSAIENMITAYNINCKQNTMTA